MNQLENIIRCVCSLAGSRILCVLVLFISTTYSSDIRTQAESFIYNNLGEGVILNFEKYNIPRNSKKEIEKTVRQRFYRDNIYLWTISDDEKNIGYAMLDNVIGKSMPITFMAIFSTDGDIIKTGIIKYREPYGGEIRSDNWNRKFIEKNKKSNFIVGESIDAITGATISVNSVTRGIHKLSLLVDYVRRR
tara:strand:- start:131 stop:703 length:573 start_codon:yes stop_codon:yes gene_type:complete